MTQGNGLLVTTAAPPPMARGQVPSFYYGEGHALFEEFDFSRGADYRSNPNVIGGTGFVLQIPLEPVPTGIVIDATSVNATTGDGTDYPLGVAEHST